MTRLPTLTSADMVAVLTRAGFQERHQRGSHLYLWHPDRRVLVCVPMHARDLKRGTMKAILKQAGLSEAAARRLL